jgi:hypothetical protein
VSSKLRRVLGTPGGVAMPENPVKVREIRFCPYCYQQSFDVTEVSGQFVYCEICGVDVDVKELEKEQ